MKSTRFHTDNGSVHRLAAGVLAALALVLASFSVSPHASATDPDGKQDPDATASVDTVKDEKKPLEEMSLLTRADPNKPQTSG